MDCFDSSMEVAEADVSMTSTYSDVIQTSPKSARGLFARTFCRTDSYDENVIMALNGVSSITSSSNINNKSSSAGKAFGTPDCIIKTRGTPGSVGGEVRTTPTLGQHSEGNIGRFQNDFEVIRTLGGGIFGTVYAARGIVDSAEYAVKKSKRRFHGDNDREKMMMEIHAISRLSAQSEDDEVFSIVRYFSAWIEDDYIFLQMELCETSLEEIIAQGQVFSATDVFLVLRHVLLALKFLHSHDFVHLDIKPANIMRKHGHYKLGDFGLARRFISQGHVMSGVEEGDSRYLASELLEWNVKDKDLTKADLFSLGITAYELVMRPTDSLPQNGEFWHLLRSNNFPLAPSPVCSQELVDVIKSLMHADPSQRPPPATLLSTFIGLASDKEKEIYLLTLTNEALKSKLHEAEAAVASRGSGRLKRHHSII